MKPREFWINIPNDLTKSATEAFVHGMNISNQGERIHVREVMPHDEAKEKLFEWLVAGLAGMFCPHDNIQEMITDKMDELGLLPKVNEVNR